MRIGENILKIRREKTLKRSVLVDKMRAIYGDSAVDYRTVERIESGHIDKGRLSTLLQISDALGVDIDKLYEGTQYEDRETREEIQEEIFITRPAMRKDIFKYNDKASMEIISPPNSKYISFILKIEPDGKTGLEQDPPDTLKFIFVTNGEINITVGRITRILYKGDFAEFNSHKVHFFENKSGRPASALLYQNPKHY